MNRRLPLVMATVALVATLVPQGDAARAPAHSKRQAEVNVLRAIARKWKAKPLPEIRDQRTHLLLDNTEAVCKGRGKRRGLKRYSRFLCVVRPHIHTRRQGLYLSYRTLPKNRFALSWLAYRRR
jgi:hypothetical protein